MGSLAGVGGGILGRITGWDSMFGEIVLSMPFCAVMLAAWFLWLSRDTSKNE